MRESARELTIAEVKDGDGLEARVAAALEAGTGVLTFEDEKGRRSLVPVAAVSYVQFGPGTPHKIGFTV